MLKTVGIALLVVIVAVLVYVATRPDTFRVERSISIRGTPEAVFPLVNDFRRWEAWSPWEKVDPQVRRTYSGAPAGKGAVYAWSGDKNVGAGRMEIVESEAPSRILIQIDFLAPFEAHNTVEFTLTREGESTRVVQAMYGPSPFISKLMGLFFSIDKMVGDKYEEGLANLKRLAER